MLDTQNAKKTQRELVVAGQRSGKPVSITPIAEPVYHEMVKLARRGNYWASLCINGVHSLVSGHLHQSNIFIKPGVALRNGCEEFTMILPGCKVTVEKQSSDGFRVLCFEADLNYFELQKKEEAPGLHRAKKLTVGEWDAEYVKSGLVGNKQDCTVAIADANHSDVKAAVSDIAPRISDSSISGGSRFIDNNGFDFHYTPNKGKLGGMMNRKYAFNPNSRSDVHASALLLAKTMYEARGIKGINWVSEFGGSVVLTQALTILAAQNVKLKDHFVFLYRPTSAPNKALDAAHAVGLKIDRKFSKSHMFDVVGNSGQLRVILSRLKKENEYTAFKAVADFTAQTKNIKGASAAVAAAAGAVGLSMAAPAAVVPFLTALGVAAATSGKALASAAIGAKVVEAQFPKTYQKIKSKF